MSLRTVLFVLFSALLFASCLASGGTGAADVSKYLSDALADGTFTAEEMEGFRAMLEAYGNSVSSSFDWTTIAGTILGGAVTAVTGIRFLPNSLIVGKQEAQAINKAAGIG